MGFETWGVGFRRNPVNVRKNMTFGNIHFHMQNIHFHMRNIHFLPSKRLFFLDYVLLGFDHVECISNYSLSNCSNNFRVSFESLGFSKWFTKLEWF